MIEIGRSKYCTCCKKEKTEKNTSVKKYKRKGEFYLALNSLCKECMNKLSEKYRREKGVKKLTRNEAKKNAEELFSQKSRHNRIAAEAARRSDDPSKYIEYLETGRDDYNKNIGVPNSWNAGE